jgi:hypothetical protein
MDAPALLLIRPKKMLWFRLHAPVKVGTEGDEFLFIKDGDLFTTETNKISDDLFLFDSFSPFSLYISSQPPLVGGATAKTIKIFRHGGFQVDTDG